MTNEIVISKDDRDIRKKPWLVRWYSDYDPVQDTRKRHCRSFSTRKLAERFVDELKYNLANGLSQDKKAITLGDFCAKFLDAKSNKYSLGTLRHYQYTTDRLNAYFSPNTPLATIDEEYAEQFINNMDYVREDLKTKRTISNSARNVTLRNCKTLFQTAVRWKYLQFNVFEGISQVDPKKQEWHHITPQEFEQILSACTTISKRAFYAVQYGCGLRAGEAMNLLWNGSNVDFKSNKIHLFNRPPSPEIPPYSLKTYKPRSVPMPDWAVDLVKELQKQMNPGNPFIFLSDKKWATVQRRWKRMQATGKEEKWDPNLMLSNTLTEFKRCCRRAGIKTHLRLCQHCLRKGWATNLAGAGVGISTLMKLGGWSSVECCTGYYLKSTDANEKQAVEVLNGLVRGKGGGNQVQ